MKQQTKHSATIGRPERVVLENILGACPRRDSPYSIRLEMYTPVFPDEKADTRTQALMIDGRALIPTREKARTKGEDAAVLPVALSNAGSFEGTSRPTTKIPQM